MNPTESYKNKTQGKITTNQRIMEVFEFLELGQRDKKDRFKKKPSKASAKNGRNTLVPTPVSVKPVALQAKKNKSINMLPDKARPKSSKVARSSIPQKKSIKAKLQLEMPRRSYNDNSDNCHSKKRI